MPGDFMLRRMSRSAAPIVLSPEEHSTLIAWARGRRHAHRRVVRAHIITMAADGVRNQDIAKRLGVSRPTVQLWRDRFLALRVAGLGKGAARAGRTPQSAAQNIYAVGEGTVRTTA